MPSLGVYSNVLNTALIVLQRKGFRVWTNESESNWYAEKDGWDFLADDPIQLLGLVSIFEFQKPSQFKEYWWMIEEPYLIERVPKDPPEYLPVWKRSGV
jgi:hypothetical protein